jgi:hypothetical protein
VLVKLYVTPTDDDTLDHVKLIDVAFEETVVQDPVSVGAEKTAVCKVINNLFKFFTPPVIQAGKIAAEAGLFAAAS